MIVAISAMVVNFTKAKYRTTESIPLINGTVNYDLADLNAVAVYLQDESATDGYAKADTIPTEGYTFNEEMSYCTIDGNRDDSITLNYNADTQSLSVSPLTTTGTKCYLYFDEQASIKDTLLSYYPTVLTRTDFTTTVTETSTGVIYKSVDESQYDDDGEVYYFAGDPTDNWIKFGEFYWRIIRVNGNGSIRIIYSGNASSGAVISGDDTQIGTSMFNNSHGDNMYVGYTYTPNQVHGLETSSVIKETLDNWYYDNLRNYISYIDINSGFCGDRTPSTITGNSNGLGGTGTTRTYYGAYIRLYTNKNPTYKCAHEDDLYTVNESIKGNKVLIYPIGLITADEVAYAGGVYGSNNQSYYLYTGNYYWTMSPAYFYGRNAYVFNVSSDGFLEILGLFNTFGVRPVINIGTNVTITGEGTIVSPYIVS